MYTYQNFKHLFGDKSTERKMIEIYEFMMEDCHYKTHELMNHVGGDSWETLACIDRLLELKLIRRINDTTPNRNYWVYRKL